MSPSALIGGALGILIAIVSAIVVLLVIRFAVWRPPSWQHLINIVAQLLALAAFWGGGTWATGHMLQVPDQLTLETWYWLVLVIGIVILLLPMLFWLALMVGILTRSTLEAEIRKRRGW